MLKIEPEPALVKKSASFVFAYLSDFNNYKELMPEQAANWVSTTENCSFTIQGIATLALKFENKIPETEIHIVKDGKAPFDFKISEFINQVGEETEVKLIMTADVNPFVKMMAEKPLTNFMESIRRKFIKAMEN